MTLRMLIRGLMIVSLAATFSLWAPVTLAQETAPMGRLFYSPESRQLLETTRGQTPAPVHKQTVRKPYQKPKAIVKPEPLPLPEPITLQGYVKRSDGPNTVWINRQVVDENSGSKSLKVGRIVKLPQNKKNAFITDSHKLQKLDQLVIKIPGNGKIVKLKPGQRYVPAENRIDDLTTVTTE